MQELSSMVMIIFKHYDYENESIHIHDLICIHDSEKNIISVKMALR
jgi:hypothetical protein